MKSVHQAAEHKTDAVASKCFIEKKKKLQAKRSKITYIHKSFGQKQARVRR